ncbi:MAG: FkbM family methyltransferase [Anaerolineaceae bacterium]|nr:FkbM family methyltransferase [Anaerolineaceae bacterium]
MKGQWLLDLVSKVVSKKVSFKDGLSFFTARFKQKPTAFSIQGVNFDNADHIVWSMATEIFLGEEYCPSGFAINSNDVIVDIGAHRGVFVAYAALRTKNSIVAFEPDSENYRILQAFVSANRWDNVQLYNAALGAKDGYIELFQSNTSTRHSVTGIDPVTKRKLSKSIRVQAFSLEKALENLPKINFLKMDCEGAEYDIIMNSNPETLKKIEKLAMEYHENIANHSAKELADFLKNYFPQVKMKEKPGSDLGFIYAFR